MSARHLRRLSDRELEKLSARGERTVKCRLELEKGEHPESERQEIRRSLRNGVSAHPGVRREDCRRSGAHHGSERGRVRREKRAIYGRKRKRTRREGRAIHGGSREGPGGRSYGAQGGRVQNPGEEGASDNSAALGRLRGSTQGSRRQ